MLDLFSRGRLIAGFPVGTAMDTTHSYSMNPGTLRPRYYEGIDLIMKAWQATEPFAFNGRFNQQRYVNPVPRPWQQPHPPVWIPGGGSVETWDFCAENDFVYGALTYYGYKMVRETVSGYWSQVEAHGKDDNPHRLAVTQFIGVADTDAEAYKLYREPAEYFFNRSLHVYPGFTDAPGLRHRGHRCAPATSRRCARSLATSRPSTTSRGTRWSTTATSSSAVPTRCASSSSRRARELRIGHLCAMLQFGNMSDELTRYNTNLFGDKVAPGLRDAVLRVRRSVVARRMPADRHEQAASSTCSASPAIPSSSPAMRAVEAAGWEIVVPSVPGFDGVPGFQPRDEYLDWLTTFWDSIDATGAAAVPGRRCVRRRHDRRRARRAAARDGHRRRAAGAVRHRRRATTPASTSTARRRPNAWRTSSPRVCPTRSPTASRTSAPEEAPVASYLSDVAAANILWPLGDRGVAKRLHRITAPRLTLWGDLDEVNPVTNAAAWGGAEVIAGAGHLLEWDAPEQVSAALLDFLNSPRAR